MLKCFCVTGGAARTAVFAAAGIVLSALAAEGPGAVGWYTFDSAAAFGAWDPFVMTEGLIEYTGASDTVAQDVTLRPTAAANNKAVTVRVTEPDTTLTFAGRFHQERGQFIKDGPGTVRFTGSGRQTIGAANAVEGAYELTWDRETGLVTSGGDAAPAGFATFTINDGKVVFDGANQTNTINGSTWVGARALASPTLEIHGGSHTFNNWFSLSRGSGNTTTPAKPRLLVTDGARFTVNNGLVFGYANGRANFRSDGVAVFDGAGVTGKVTEVVYEGPGNSVLTVTNGAVFISTGSAANGVNATQYGWAVGATATDRFGTVDVSEGATAKASYFTLGCAGSTLSVRDGRFEMSESHGHPGYENPAVRPVAFFDNSTLGLFEPALYSDWFNAGTDVRIGARGMTMDVAAGRGAFFRAEARPADGVAGATVTKTGGGTLTVKRPKAGVGFDVREGALRFAGNTFSETNDLALTVAPGAEVQGAGDQALRGITLRAGEIPALRLLAQSSGGNAAVWQNDRRAKAFENGKLHLTSPKRQFSGVSWLRRRVDVTRDVEVTFDLELAKEQGYYGEGFGAVFQNRTTATGFHSNSFLNTNPSLWALAGAYGETVAAVCFCFTNNTVSLMLNGAVTEQSFPLVPGAGLNKLAALDMARRNPFRISYDAAGKTLRVAYELGGSGAQTRVFTGVDLAAACGTNAPYFGFVAQSANTTYDAQILLDAVVADGDGRRSLTRLGGRAEAGAGETLNLVTQGSDVSRAFALAELSYADGAAVRVTDAEEAWTGLGPGPLDFARRASWELSGDAQWCADGTDALALTCQKANPAGLAKTRDTYPAEDGWTVSFDFELGRHSTYPADLFRFYVYDAFGAELAYLGWRYFANADLPDPNKRTSLTYSFNGATQQTVNDLAPVNLVKNGPAHFEITYDPAAENLVVTITQDGGVTDTRALPFAPAAATRSTGVRFGFYGQGGGAWAENIVSNIVFTAAGTAGTAEGARRVRASAAFETWNGAGTLTKRGAGTLALHAPEQSGGAAVRVAEGRLLLARAKTTDLSADTEPEHWTFNHAEKGDSPVVSEQTTWTAAGIQMKGAYMCKSLFHRDRVPVDGSFRARFKVRAEKTASAADGFAFVLHNDPAGPRALGGPYAACGAYASGGKQISNAFAVGWYIYSYNTAQLYQVYGTSAAGAASATLIGTCRPILFTASDEARVTEVEIAYDKAARRVTVTERQGADVATQTVANVDLEDYVKDTAAYIGLGIGSGGLFFNPTISDFTFERLEDAAETTAPYLARAEFADGTAAVVETDRAGAALTLARTVAVVDGATVTVANEGAAAGTLAVPELELGAAAAFAVEAGATLDVAAVRAADGTALAKTGAGTLRLTAAAAAACGTIDAREGTLAVAGGGADAREPDLALTLGADARLALDAEWTVRRLTVAGEELPCGRYRAANAPWLVGSGALRVLEPSRGTLLLFR